MKLIVILFICFGSLLYALVYLQKKSKNNGKLKSPNIVEWMKMSTEDRKIFDRKQRVKTMERKKNLLEKIRKEYKRIDNSN
tara:strand:- start:281 stop:523 length:243 start_codon:yes stop_codon:yes gene_type:complete